MRSSKKGERYKRKMRQYARSEQIDKLSTWVKSSSSETKESLFAKPTKLDFANKNYPSWNLFESKLLWVPQQASFI